MYKHLFKLIWNKKKQNFLFLSEILISFLVIFTVFSFVIYYYQNYKQSRGFDYERVWIINYNNTQDTKNADSLTLFYENLRATLKSLPQVVDVSYSYSNIPFSESMSTLSVSYGGKSYDRVNNYRVDNGYNNVWQLKVLEGHWYSKGDINGKYKPVVIDSTLKVTLFGQQSGLGKVIGDGDKPNAQKVIGVVADMKVEGDYRAAGKSIFMRNDTSDYRGMGVLSMRVTDRADAAFESKLYKLLANTMKKSNIGITHATDMRVKKNADTIVPLIIFMIVAGFLIINVALGLFGVLWYSINRRKGEIGLRRAIGASGSGVSYQLIAESMILASLALIVGCFFAVQFPLLHVFDIGTSAYMIAIILAVLFIYLLVFLCSLYPGRQAAAILPAIALHEE
jgi:putative ABC transport system permease protein